MLTRRWGELYLCALVLKSFDNSDIIVDAYRDGDSKLALHKTKTAEPDFKWTKSDGWTVTHIETGLAFPLKFRTRSDAYRALCRFLPLFKKNMTEKQIKSDGRIRSLALAMKASARRYRTCAGIPIRVEDGFADPGALA